MYNLLCVHLKINRQSITCPLTEVFTTFHWHRGRTLAPAQYEYEYGGYRLTQKCVRMQLLQQEDMNVTLSRRKFACVSVQRTAGCTKNKQVRESLRCPLVTVLHITVLCAFWPGWQKLLIFTVVVCLNEIHDTKQQLQRVKKTRGKRKGIQKRKEKSLIQ